MIVVEGRIQGKSRPRFNTKTGRTYTPGKTKTYENHIKAAYIEQHGVNFGLLPVKARIEMYFEIPKSYTKKRVKAILEGKEQPTKKVDVDNCAKVILDALNKVAYDDDKQIIELTVIKRWTEEKERIEFELEEMVV